jgi:hypothetical protein
MDKLAEFLRDWAREFVKNKNLMTKSVVFIEDDGDGLVVEHRDREQRFIMLPFMNSCYEALKLLGGNPEMHLAVVTFNCGESFRAMLDNWKELVKHRNFCIYFVNPFSQLDKRWIIYPHTHAKICDEDSLELGLKAMFDTVEKITEEEAKSKI